MTHLPCIPKHSHSLPFELDPHHSESLSQSIPLKYSTPLPGQCYSLSHFEATRFLACCNGRLRAAPPPPPPRRSCRRLIAQRRGGPRADGAQGEPGPGGAGAGLVGPLRRALRGLVRRRDVRQRRPRDGHLAAGPRSLQDPPSGDRRAPAAHRAVPPLQRHQGVYTQGDWEPLGAHRPLPRRQPPDRATARGDCRHGESPR